MRGTYRLDAPVLLLRNAQRVHSPVMQQTTRIYEELQRCAHGDAAWTGMYDRFVARLAALEAGNSAPRPGTGFPDLHLPDHLGRYRSLAEIRAASPVVLSFVRGTWCPFCRAELADWSDHLAALRAAGGQLVVVVGEISGGADRVHAALGEEAIVLCDVDHGAALDLGLAHHAGTELLQRYLDAGLNLTDVYGTDSGILPIPATFLLDQTAMVREAFVDPDFRVRARAETMVEALRQL